jgi:hypothetical protein
MDIFTRIKFKETSIVSSIFWKIPSRMVLPLINMENGTQGQNLSGIPPFSHALFKEHLITDYSSKPGKLPNVHKHKEHGYQLLIKDKVVTQFVVKSNVLKGTEKFYLLKSIVHAYGLEPMFT